MHFDDRLATVLRQPVKGAAIARILYRQLVDLLGTVPAEARGPAVDAAHLRLAELARTIPAAERARLLREPGLRLRNPRLVAQFADDEAAVVAAALAVARLDETQWLDLIPALPPAARMWLRDRADLPGDVAALLRRLGVIDRGLPAPALSDAPALADEVAAAPQAAAAPAEAAPPPPVIDLAEAARERRAARAEDEEPHERIGAIVRRIEEFRRARQIIEAEQAGGDAPRSAPGEPAEPHAPPRCAAFDFETDGEGRIVWAEAAVAPMVVGLRLAARDPEGPAAASPGLAAAWRRQQPVRGAALRIDGAPAIAGDWIVDAAPRFDRTPTRFTGYCGRMRRPPEEAAPAPDPRARETDRMRQVLHELRTPVNAIQGFAELIQQQLFGRTPHEYRALAAAIAGDAARILAGFEELDRLARLDSGTLEPERGDSDLAEVTGRLLPPIEAFLAPRGSRIGLVVEGGAHRVPLARAEAERTVWRILATLAAATSPGEALALRIGPRDDGAGAMVALEARLPAALAGHDDAELFRVAAPAQAQALSAGMFGTGFALRLAASEARGAGGAFGREGEYLRLALPCLTAAAAGHSEPSETIATGAAS